MPTGGWGILQVIIKNIYNAMTSGEAAAIATIIFSGLSFLGVSGLTPELINQAVQGVLALFTLCTTVYAWRKHRGTAAELRVAQGIIRAKGLE